MTNTANSRRKVQMPSNIRKKFAAALVMLLIAAIMLISSTYAWFTLSTAPEVTGITTNVGANGNLEIALLNHTNFTSDAADLGVLTNVGDSMEAASQTIEQANGTWGNLIDLSPVSYGLPNIVLNPSALNITDAATTGSTIGTTMLLAPSYGSDGRVMTVDKQTVTGQAQGTSFTVADDYNGVRAIGVSSGITLRQSSYTNALANITVNMSRARSAAAASLVDNGANLGGLLMKIAAASDPTSVTFTREEVEYILPMLAGLESANDYVLTAAKYAALAYTFSAANTAELTDEQVSTISASALAADRAGLASVTGLVIPASVTAVLNQYDTAAAEIAAANTEYQNLTTGANETKDSYSYSEVNSLINKLINKQYVSVGGVTNPGRNDISELADVAMSGNPVEIVMLPGSGIYADIATNAGNYTAGPMRVPVSYSGLSMTLTVNMNAQGETPILLTEAIQAGQDAGSPGGTGATSIDDTYGYALDFGFRTNASASHLLLQQGGKQRVYNVDGQESQNALTQGQGSYVQFTSTNINTFSIEEMVRLMSALRVVFAEPTISEGVTSYNILGIAAPEVDITVDQGTGAVSYSGEAVGTDGWKVQLAMYNYTAEPVNGNEVKVVLGEKKTGEDALTLCALEQNVGKKITVIVYLDGDVVDNTMVANAETSMNGTLNLQFASDVDLIPMENTDLRNGGNSSTPATPSIPDTISQAQLNTAINTVKSSTAYTGGTEGDALHTAVTTAEAAAAETKDNYKDDLTALGTAYVAAGGTLTDLLP